MDRRLRAAVHGWNPPPAIGRRSALTAAMSARRPYDDQQLELFRARRRYRRARRAGSWPFLARQSPPRDADRLPHGRVSIRVEATVEHGMATIWDADV
jgi:plasmid replication initiation protein